MTELNGATSNEAASTGEANRQGDSPLLRRKMMDALNAARSKLLERSLRNKLISTNLTSQRARQIRVVDELSDQVIALLRSGKAMTFAANQRSSEGVAEEVSPTEELPYIPPDDEGVSEDGVATRHRDLRLQTRLTPEGLQKRLLSLFYEAQTIEEEQGVNVLFLALGFLEWHEANHSDITRYAPLVLLPIDLARDGAKDRFKIKLREEDLFTNVCLQAWLDEQTGIKFPELPDWDDWKPSDYFQLVRDAIGKQTGWAVRENEIVLGFFSFSKFLLWRDLDPANWPAVDNLLGCDLLSRILLREESDTLEDVPLIAEDARIDEVFRPSELVHVSDADSSQAIAIQEALSGKNLVIQGPPGTGKSQTITNIIAGAVHRGKRVLFIAEKMAALDVVHQRLVKKGLGAICLELHSRKASKAQVLDQIKQGMTAPAPPTWSTRAFTELEETQKALRSHSDRVHAVIDGSLSAYALMGRMSLLKATGAPTPTFEFPKAASWKAAQIDEAVVRANRFEERLARAGVPARHPWRGIGITTPDRLQQDRIRPLVDSITLRLRQLTDAVNEAKQVLRPQTRDTIAGIPIWVTALRCIAQRPLGVDDVLAHGDLPKDTVELRALAREGQRLAELRNILRGVVVEAAWEQNWSSIRLLIASHGQSPFRIFSRAYRSSLKALRGFAIGKLPSRFQERIAILDSLIEGQKFAASIEAAGKIDREYLGSLWRGEGSDWQRIIAICDWTDLAANFAPQINVRSATALVEPARAILLSKSLLEQCDAFLTAYAALKDSVALDELLAFDGRPFGSLSTAELSPICERWRHEFSLIVDWPPIRDDLHWLREIECGDLADQVFRGAITASQVSPVLQLAAYEAVWKIVRRNIPEIDRTNGDELDALVKRFRYADEDRIRIAADEVAKAHIDQHPTGSAGAVGVLRDETKKSRRLKAVRKLMEEAGEAIQRFKPVFLMSPLSVAQYLKPGSLAFDLLLIDEASQVRPEDALGAIARCGQLVVVGDDRQLPPTNFFNRVVNDDDLADEDNEQDEAIRTAAVKDIESILNLCSRFPERMLRWHYRSEHPVLIAISNRHFYKNQLMLPPSVVAKATDGKTGLIFHKVKEGGYERGTTARNVIEAEEVALAVLEHVRTSASLSLGIGTFSSAQRDAIRHRLDLVAAEHSDVEAFMKRPPKGEGLFVKNLENIQGDERDVIFISVGYGRDKDGRLTQNFGPVGREGGERRLNVLITRARKRCEIFSSIVGEDIKFEGVGKPGVVALKEFLKLAKDGYADFASPTGKSFDSEFEESVALAIKALGFDYHPQVGMAGFYIDIGVLDPRDPDRYILGVECDGAAYHSSRYCRDRDRLRQQILESRGWNIHRIWSTDWFYRQESEVLKLRTALEGVLAGNGLPKATDIYGSGGTYAERDLPVSADQKVDLHELGEEQTEFKYESEAPEAKLRPYEFAQPNVPERGRVSPHRIASGRLVEIVMAIVSIEQPIHEEEVARRLAASFDLQRAGNLIQGAANNGLLNAKRRGLLQKIDAFWVTSPAPTIVPRDRSDTPLGSSVRRSDFIAQTEYQATIRVALEQNLAMHREELVAEVARLLGFARTGKDLAAAIGSAIDAMLATGAIEIDHVGRIRLKH